MTDGNQIFCFGDSITKGVPGVSYLNYLDTRYINRGVGGDTLTSMAKRLRPFLNNKSNLNIIIEIGANDILLPYLTQSSAAWKRTINLKQKAPIEDPTSFYKHYEALINDCHLHNLLIVNIPCLGETNNSELNQKVDQYNLQIKTLCTNHNIPLVDFNHWQKQHQVSTSTYFISKHPTDVIIDGVLTTPLNKSTQLSSKRNLTMTIDGVHLNEFGAQQLATMISNTSFSNN